MVYVQETVYGGKQAIYITLNTTCSSSNTVLTASCCGEVFILFLAETTKLFMAVLEDNLLQAANDSRLDQMFTFKQQNTTVSKETEL